MASPVFHREKVRDYLKTLFEIELLCLSVSVREVLAPAAQLVFGL